MQFRGDKPVASDRVFLLLATLTLVGVAGWVVFRPETVL